MNRIKSLLFVLFVVFDHFIISFFFFQPVSIIYTGSTGPYIVK